MKSQPGTPGWDYVLTGHLLAETGPVRTSLCLSVGLNPFIRHLFCSFR